MDAPAFIVSTGRCGSTMISNMLREHPAILSVSQLYSLISDGSRTADPFTQEPIDGARFWSIISAKPPFVNFLQKHEPYRPAEILYPYDAPTARFSIESGVPGILLSVLPHLAEDPHLLFDELERVISGWPIAPIREHYTKMFAWLSGRFHKRLWVERSAASLGRIPALLELFPEARFVHLVRDGRDVALSMHREVRFRIAHATNAIAQYLGHDPFHSPDRTRIDRVPERLRRLLPECFDVEALGEYEVPLARCGLAWSKQILTGLNALGALPKARVLTLRYEDLLIDPTAQLSTLIEFLGDHYRDEGWVGRCRGLIGKPRSCRASLLDRELEQLEAACSTGFTALRTIQIHYE